MNAKLKLTMSAAAILLVVGGCQKKATGQVVAVVNGEEITQQQLNSEMQRLNVPPTADKKKVTAEILQRIVDRKLIVQQAKAEGLDKTPEYIEQSLNAQDALLFNLLGAKVSKTLKLPDDAKITQFIAANPAMFGERKRYSLDQVAFANTADAATMKELEPAHSLDEVVAVLGRHNVPFARGKGQLDTATTPPPILASIAKLPAGEPFITPNAHNYVASVITGVTATPTPPEQTKAIAFNLLRQQALNEAIKARLDKAKADAKIEYQPGFSPPAPAKK